MIDEVDALRDRELADIIVTGSLKVELKFGDAVIRSITRLSAGFPHFTHLLALRSAEEAIVEGRREIRLSQVQDIMQDAAKDAEATLKRLYDQAIQWNQTGMYRDILLAAASLDSEVFTAEELRISLGHVAEEPLYREALDDYFTQLIASDHGEPVLRLLKRDVYQFRDPRMPSYIKMVNSDFLEPAGS